MKPAPFVYRAASNLAHALELLDEADGNAKILAGGQSLVPLMNLRKVTPPVLVDIGRCTDMNEIRVEDDCLAIGALVTYRALEESELVAAHCGLLVDALGYVGAPAVRNRGTLGGSLVHADPTAEAPTVVAALGGELTIAGSSGERTARFAEFCQGAYRVELAPTEIVTEVRVPKLLDGAVWGFAEVSHRFGSSAQMAAAAALHLDGERVVAAWISIAGLAGVPTRARIAEQALSGQAAIADEFDKTAHVAVDELAAAGEDPYRRQLARVVVGRALARARQQATGVS